MSLISTAIKQTAVSGLQKLTSPNFPRAVGAGRVLVFPASDGFGVECWLAGPCLPTGSGVGGWGVAARQGAKGIVEYVGVEPDRYTLPLLLDGWIDGDEQQTAFDALLAMASARGDLPPDEIRVIGTVPPAVSKSPWRIETVTPGTNTKLMADGRLLRQDLVLTLIEPVDPGFAQKPVKKAKAKAGKKGQPVYVVAKHGDTLLTIAARTGKDWHDLAKLNSIRDPAHVKANQKIRIS